MKISAEELRLVRGHLDLTQAEFADYLDVSPRTIVNWETNGVPESKVARTRRVLGRHLDEALEIEAFHRSSRENQPTDEQYQQWLEEYEATERPEVTRLGMSAEQRRAHLLQAFSDMDLLNELKSRSFKRGSRDSHWNAERMERYQKFVAPQWVDPDYSKMSDEDVRQNRYDLAAKEADKNIGFDDLPNEP